MPQLVQLAAADTPEYLPGPHFVQLIAAALEAVPAGHATQVVDDGCPTSALYRPAAQPVQPARPLPPPYRPLMQGRQTVAPVAGCDVPALHAMQLKLFVNGW
jgi:hypothetical protein